MTRTGLLFVMSAPSGTGKSSLARRVLDRTEHLAFSVSHTTRAPRSDERDGREYHFIDEKQFRAMVSRDEFLEWAEVHGSLYGTSGGPARRILESGRDLLLDIDVQGAAQVRRSLPEAVTIFILPPDFETLRQRLVARGMDPPAQLERRLAAARAEAGEFRRYDYVVVNHDLDQAAEEVRSVVISERRRTSRMEEAAQEILATFEEANT